MKSLNSDQRGQTVVVVALFLTTLLLGLGLAVDGGQLFSARRSAQVAADAGAWAGAVKLYSGGTAAAAKTEACADIARNGFSVTDCPNGPNVIVNSPPTSGAFSGNASYVEVIISQSVATTFFKATGVQALTSVSGRAVGGLPNCGGTTDAVLVLDNTAGSSFNLSNSNAKLVVNGSGIETLSNSGTSIVISGSAAGSPWVTGHTFFRTRGVGGTAANLAKIGPVAPVNASGTLSPSDPLACLTKPSAVGMTTYSGVDINGPNQTVSSGIFTNGFRVRGGSVLTLNPGVYVLKGGNGLTISGASSIVAPSGGVLLYNTNSSYPAAGGTCGSISMAGTSTVNLSAQRTGSYAGLLLWDDSVCGPDQAMTITSSWTTFSGTVYFPSAGNQLTLTLSSNVAVDAQFVVNRFRINSARTLTVNYDPLKVYGGPALVE